MAFDGITIANVVHELNGTILDGRINKIAQPEADELLLTIKMPRGQKRLYISASASLPLIYLTDENKPSPMTAPNFCMLLRKHINNGRITKIYQPKLERIICFEIEHLDELGDLCKKRLIVEIMGKHSNIIFCNDKGMIIDSIKHVSSQMSSVREETISSLIQWKSWIRLLFQKMLSSLLCRRNRHIYPKPFTQHLPGSVLLLQKKSAICPA